MDINTFINGIQGNEPPATLSVYLKALWYDAKDKWDRAHELIQDIKTPEAAWIHAYLHREEGDNANADYWYKRAGKKRPVISLQQEWEDIVNTFLQ